MLKFRQASAAIIPEGRARGTELRGRYYCARPADAREEPELLQLATELAERSELRKVQAAWRGRAACCSPVNVRPSPGRREREKGAALAEGYAVPYKKGSAQPHTYSISGKGRRKRRCSLLITFCTFARAQRANAASRNGR